MYNDVSWFRLTLILTVFKKKRIAEKNDPITNTKRQKTNFQILYFGFFLTKRFSSFFKSQVTNIFLGWGGSRASEAFLCINPFVFKNYYKKNI